MRERGKTDLPAFKTPLQPMTAQEKRQFLASIAHDYEPTGEITLCFRLPEDILSPEGKKRWDSQKASCYEQTEITQIEEDVLIEPSKVRTIPPKENVFQSMDQKIAESKMIAKKIKTDFEALNIPPPTEPIEVEPLFADSNRSRQYERSIPDHSGKLTTDFSSLNKKDPNKSQIRDRQRALQAVKTAERTLSKCSDRPKDKKSETTTSRRPYKSQQIRWDKVTEYVQEEEF